MRLFLVFCLGLFVLTSCSGRKQVGGNGNTISAVTENAYPPLNFINDNGESVGLEYDLTNKIAEKLGYRVNWNVAGWDVMIQSVRQGMYDVGMDGISITDERREEVDFSIPYMKIEFVMLVRSDEDRFSSSKELVENSKLKVGSQVGTTTFYTAVDMMGGTPENPGDRVVLFQSFGPSVQALLAGDIDMVITDLISGKGYVNSTGGRVRVLDDEILATEEMAFIFRKGSPLVSKFNDVIEEFRIDGTLDAMVEKWFSIQPMK